MRYVALVAVLAAVAVIPGAAMAECSGDHAATPVTAQTDSKAGEATRTPEAKVAATQPVPERQPDGQVPVAQKTTK